ncbi:MAG: hypothetical protein GY913_21580 [Proteobacteria bacterium]|nr:hypothetical protein [Pseudomonadota bacterium]
MRRLRAGEDQDTVASSYDKTWRQLYMLLYKHYNFSAREAGCGKTPGPKHGATRMARLNPDDVRTIRQRVREGETPNAIAQDYPVSGAAIRAILRGRTWKHVA